jgi:hypothetical protein
MKVYVGNLSRQINDAQLNELAVPYGTVVSVAGLDGRDVNGQAIKVNESKPRNPDAGRR